MTHLLGFQWRNCSSKLPLDCSWLAFVLLCFPNVVQVLISTRLATPRVLIWFDFDLCVWTRVFIFIFNKSLYNCTPGGREGLLNPAMWKLPSNYLISRGVWKALVIFAFPNWYIFCVFSKYFIFIISFRSSLLQAPFRETHLKKKRSSRFVDVFRYVCAINISHKHIFISNSEKKNSMANGESL